MLAILPDHTLIQQRRLNNTFRQRISRLVRESLSFSKKADATEPSSQVGSVAHQAMENHVGEPFGILSMTTMHSWQRIKPTSLLPNHHQRMQRRHSNFYIGLHGKDWVDSCQLFSVESQALMQLSPQKSDHYRRGKRAISQIQSSL